MAQETMHSGEVETKRFDDLQSMKIKRLFNVVNVFYIDRIRRQEFAVPPFFKEHLRNVFFEEGKVLQFHCTVGGFPPPEIEWYKGLDRIEENVEEEDLCDCIGYKYYATNDKGNLLLIITNILPEDFGPYTCKIRNIVGEARSTATLYALHEQGEGERRKSSGNDKKVVVKETITIVERKSRVDAGGSANESVDTTMPSTLDKEDQEKRSRNAPSICDSKATGTLPGEQLMTVMFTMPKTCETRSVKVETSKMVKRDFEPITSHTQKNEYGENNTTSEERWNLFDEPPGNESTRRYYEEGTTSPIETNFSPRAVCELQHRVRWIQCGERSESEFRKDAISFSIPQCLTDSPAYEETQSNSSRTFLDDVATRQKNDWLYCRQSNSDVGLDTSEEESNDTMGNVCGNFFSNRGYSEDRLSQYTDVFEDDVLAFEKRGFQDEFDASTDGGRTLHDLSPLACDSASSYKKDFGHEFQSSPKIEHEDQAQAMDIIDLQCDASGIAESFSATYSDGARDSTLNDKDDQQNIAIDDSSTENVRLEELDAAQKLDELIAKLIEFSQKNYVRVSSLKVGPPRKRINNAAAEEVISADVLCQKNVPVEAASIPNDGDIHIDSYSVQKMDIPLHPSDLSADDEDEVEAHAPKFVIPLQDMEIGAEENAVLNVSVTGFPAPQISWFKDGQPLHEAESGIIYDDLKRHSATYTCIAENESGEAVTSARMTVQSTMPCGTTEAGEKLLRDQSVVKLRRKTTIEAPEKRGSQIISASLVDYLRAKAKSFQQSRLVSEISPVETENEADGKDRIDIYPRVSKSVEGLVRDDVTLRRGSMLSLISMSTTSFESADENLTSSDAVWEEVASTCEEDFMSTDEFIFPGMRRDDDVKTRFYIPGQYPTAVDSDDELFTPRPSTPSPVSIKPPFEYEVTANTRGRPFTRQPTDPQLFETNSSEDMHTAPSENVTPVPPGDEDTMMRLEYLQPSHPKFLVPLKDASFPLGCTGSLTCYVVGNPAPHVAWYRNGIRILPPGPDGRISPRSFLTSFPAADSSTVTPPQRFEITSEMRQDRTKGVASVKYESHTLSISNCRSTDAAEYSVTAVNLYGNVMSKALITIKNNDDADVTERPEFSAPHFVRKISDSDGMLGGQATMTFQLTGDPEPDITIFHDKEEVEWKKFALAKDGHGQYTLTISDLRLEDEGEVHVCAMNVIGYAECAAELFVDERNNTPTQEKFGIPQWSEHADDVDFGMLDIREQLTSQVITPYFDDIADDVTCPNGADASFAVRVYAWPAPVVFWFKEEEQLPNEGRFSVESTDFGTHVLKIHAVTERDAGIYTCVVKNNAGQVSCKAELSISVEKSPSLSSDEEESMAVSRRHLKDHYTVCQDIGTGTFSVIRLVLDKTDNTEYAAKYIRCTKAQWREKFLIEVEVLKSLSQKNIVGYKDFFETKKHIILVAEYASCEWFEFLLDKNDLQERDIALQVGQLCDGLQYLHEKGVVHLDMKPENVMVADSGCTLKIIDFGSAKAMKKEEDVYWDYGNPEFVSPDVVNSLPVTLATDMWSLGVIVYTVISGISPFLGESDYASILQVRGGNLEFDTKWFASVSNEAKDFIRKTIVLDPIERMSSLQAKSHEWIEQGEKSNRMNPLPEGRLKYFLSRRRWQRSLVGPKTSLSLRSISSLLKQEYDSASVAVSRNLINDYISSSTVTESEDEIDDFIVDSAPTSPAFRHKRHRIEDFMSYAPRLPKTSISIEDAIEEQTVGTPALTVTDSTPKSSPTLQRKCPEISNAESQCGTMAVETDSTGAQQRTEIIDDAKEVQEKQPQPLSKYPHLSPIAPRERLKMIGKKVSFEDEPFNTSDLEQVDSPLFLTGADKTELTEPVIVTEEVESKEIPPVAQMPEVPKPTASSGPAGVNLDRPQSVSKLLKEDRREPRPRRSKESENRIGKKGKVKKKLSLKSLRRFQSFDVVSSTSSSEEDSRMMEDKRECLQKDTPASGKSKLSFFSRRKRSVIKGGSLDFTTQRSKEKQMGKREEIIATPPSPENPPIKGILKRGGSTDTSSQSDPHMQKSLQKSLSPSPKVEANQESFLGSRQYRRRPLVKGVSLDFEIVAEKSPTSRPKNGRRRERPSVTERRRAQMRRGSSAESALIPQTQPRVSGLRGPLLEKGDVEGEPTAGMSLRRSMPVIKGNHSRSYSGPLNIQSPGFERGKLSPLSLSPRVSSPFRKYSPLSRSFFSYSMDLTSTRPSETTIQGDISKDRKSLSAKSASSLPRSRSQDRYVGKAARNSDKRGSGENYAPYLKVPLIDQGLTQNQAYATLSCLIDGSPLPEVIWCKDGQEILASDRIEIFSEPSINRYQLKIRNLNILSDYGEYSCEARNSVGGVKSSCALMKAVAPEKPSAPELSGTDGENVWVTWNPPSNCAATPMSYLLQYREMAAMKWVVVADCIKDTLYRVENLRQTTSYRFRVRAVNNAGAGPFSKVSQRIQLDPKDKSQSLHYAF